MSQTNDSDGFDPVVNDLNPILDSDSGTTAWQKVRDSAAVDDVQIVLSDLLAAGIDAIVGWFTR